MTKPLEGWDEEQRAIIQRDIFDTGLSRHLPTVGALLVVAVASFEEPPTKDDLARVITSPTNPGGSWDGPGWEEPKRYTAEELARLRADFGPPGEEPEDPDEAYADDLARFHANRARIDGYAAHYGLPPVRTCRDVLELLVAAGILHRVVEDGAIRFRPAWPLPLAEDVLPISAEDRAEEDAHRWDSLHYGTGQKIIRLLKPDADHRKDSLTTSLERLGRTLDLDPDSVREGVLVLLGEGDFTANVDIARAPRHKVFTLTVDWDRFAATRIGIRRGDAPDADPADE
jgi:hypothetical protein